MAKTSKSYSCSSCGIVTNKWAGRCDGCGDWNTLQESKAFSNGPHKISIGNEKGEKVSLSDLSPNLEFHSYSKSGIAEAPENVKDLAERRWKAKQDKDWAESDRLRDEINSHGWIIKDDKKGFKLEPEKN